MRASSENGNGSFQFQGDHEYSTDVPLDLGDSLSFPFVTLRRWSSPLLVLMLLGIGILTLSPQPDPGFGGTGFRCLLCGSRGVADLLLNVALFMPFGWILGARGARPIIGLGIALAIAGGIECLQLVIPGREATIRDVLANGIGGGIGAMLFAHGRNWIVNRGPARLAASVALVILIGAVGIVGPALSPRGAPDRIFVGWNPSQDHLERWTGTIERAEIGGKPAVPGGTADGPLINDVLLRGEALEIHATAGVPTTRVAGIFTVNDLETNEILIVGVERLDLVVRFRRLASVLRLDSPVLRFRAALAPVRAGEPMRIRVRVSNGRACATVNASSTCSPPFSVGSAWTLLAWRDESSTGLIRLLDTLTLAGLFGLLALFCPATGRRFALFFLGCAASAIPIIAHRWGLRLFSPPEILGIAAGIVGGLILGSILGSSTTGRAALPQRDSPL